MEKVSFVAHVTFNLDILWAQAALSVVNFVAFVNTTDVDLALQNDRINISYCFASKDQRCSCKECFDMLDRHTHAALFHVDFSSAETLRRSLDFCIYRQTSRGKKAQEYRLISVDRCT